MAKPLQPTSDQLAALGAYAARHGDCWKHKLAIAWLNGQDEQEPEGALLRQVRNTFGPRWLAEFKLRTAAGRHAGGTE